MLSLSVNGYRIQFSPPGASLTATLVDDNSDATFAVVTGANRSTFSLTGVVVLPNGPQGTVPAGTAIRLDGVASNNDRVGNVTLTVCPVAGVVAYRRPGPSECGL